jgi:choline kinase
MATPLTSATCSAAAGTDLAVVIAAGAGTRLRASCDDDTIVKPMSLVLGVPLIARTLATLKNEGVREAVIVTGYRAEELDVLPAHPWLEGLRLHFAHNPHWAGKNGVSVSAAREAVAGRPFFLSMADHLYAPDLVARLRAEPPAPGELVLAVDRRVHEVMDPDDAMGVHLDSRGRILAIGKDLHKPHAIDTGVFLATAGLFEALAEECEERGGDCALADGVRRMATRGKARTVDIGDAWWQDVDTRDNLRLAEAKLRRAESRDRELPAATGV